MSQLTTVSSHPCSWKNTTTIKSASNTVAKQGTLCYSNYSLFGSSKIPQNKSTNVLRKNKPENNGLPEERSKNVRQNNLFSLTNHFKPVTLLTQQQTIEVLMSYSLKYTHQITFTYNGKVFETIWSDHNRQPSQDRLAQIDGEITKIVTIPQY